MKWFKHIPVLLIWFAASWPCSHAVGDVHHEHDHADGIALCAAAEHSCECHSCNEVPCTDRTIELVSRITIGDTVWIRPIHTLSDPLPDIAVIRRHLLPQITGSIDWLRTIQLLI